MDTNQLPAYAQRDIAPTVARALSEDIGSGDITAQLLPVEQQATARVITRETAIICGRAWVDEVFWQLDPQITLDWQVDDGERVGSNGILFECTGSARSILTAERTALNFLQLLSGTATICRHYANQLLATNVILLDTRKTIPGLRTAQKYAVTCGGCHNHRIGLFDAFLIKENHIAAHGSIQAAVKAARSQATDKPMTVEVENIDQLQQALAAGVDHIMLDNFSLPDLQRAVTINAGSARLEVSGGVTEANLETIANTGIDAISIGALTKNCRAIDLSLQLLPDTTN